MQAGLYDNMPNSALPLLMRRKSMARMNVSPSGAFLPDRGRMRSSSAGITDRDLPARARQCCVEETQVLARCCARATAHTPFEEANSSKMFVLNTLRLLQLDLALARLLPKVSIRHRDVVAKVAAVCGLLLTPFSKGG